MALNVKSIENSSFKAILKINMAESQGFEPWDACTSPVFKTGALSRSTNSPY